MHVLQIILSMIVIVFRFSVVMVALASVAVGLAVIAGFIVPKTDTNRIYMLEQIVLLSVVPMVCLIIYEIRAGFRLIFN